MFQWLGGVARRSLPGLSSQELRLTDDQLKYSKFHQPDSRIASQFLETANKRGVIKQKPWKSRTVRLGGIVGVSGPARGQIRNSRERDRLLRKIYSKFGELLIHIAKVERSQ